MTDRLSPEGTPEDFATADVVFVGTVVRRDEPLTFGTRSWMDPISWTFVVETVEKGGVVDRIRVESPGEPASCGVQFRLGQRYRVFAHRAGWLSLSVMQGDVEYLEPLANPPPTEPGGINFLTVATIVPVLGVLVVVVPLGWALADVARERRRSRMAPSAGSR